MMIHIYESYPAMGLVSGAVDAMDLLGTQEIRNISKEARFREI